MAGRFFGVDLSTNLAICFLKSICSSTYGKSLLSLYKRIRWIQEQKVDWVCGCLRHFCLPGAWLGD